MVEDQSVKQKMMDEIKGIVAKVVKLPADKIDPQANLFSDVGVDSLLGVEIFSALDKKYNIDVPEDRLRNISNLNDILALVMELKRN